MYLFSGVTMEGEDSANSRVRSTSATAPSTTLSASSLAEPASSRADSSTLRAITGIITLSCKFPCAPENATQASVQMPVRAAVRDSAVVAEHLRVHHHRRLADHRVDLARHDRTARWEVGELQL